MNQRDFYNIYVKHAKYDYECKTLNSFYAGMTETELYKVGVTKGNIKYAVKKNWLKPHYFARQNTKTTLKAYLFIAEEARQRGLKRLWYALKEKLGFKPYKNFD